MYLWFVRWHSFVRTPWGSTWCGIGIASIPVAIAPINNLLSAYMALVPPKLLSWRESPLSLDQRFGHGLATLLECIVEWNLGEDYVIGNGRATYVRPWELLNSVMHTCVTVPW
ncbi:uncharacterized protein EV420DRAFT_1482104 [Desarmillaria tabescens]|uniref:Uncharacterized protein n=1 Tax=Armillaria tabescens TaxID=1929756 RepID=A0AA39N0F0_ARMTA|nr:uncharacterized protein EV420DRAFT_1482104 [Desarmillaria tabescens]KAK0452809.1 hypothetical protein EV420DRAFT_1482104 [Desarmillaria tabescens]